MVFEDGHLVVARRWQVSQPGDAAIGGNRIAAWRQRIVFDAYPTLRLP